MARAAQQNTLERVTAQVSPSAATQGSAGTGCSRAVDTHGTATIRNDPAETYALRTVFGPHLDDIPATAIKSAIGHLIGAAGAVAAVAAVTAVQTLGDGLLPPTQNHDHTDPECDIDLVTGAPRPATPHTILSQAFGFGGHNSVLVLAAP